LEVRKRKMRAFEFSRFALSIGVGAAMLSACGGGPSVPIATGSPINDAGAVKGNKTFKYTGSEQTFKVPKGVTQLTVVARGGEGAGFSTYPSTDTPGRPGRVSAIIPVSPGEKLYVFVGGSGTDGGFNGGGAGAYSTSHGAGNPGGGASDVRVGGTGILERIIVAAGGGGAGEADNIYGTNPGGNGGGLFGKDGGGGASYGSGDGGKGGTQSQGGAGGAGAYGYFGSGRPGGGGDLGSGGNGGDGAEYAGNGGGGGGGYYGGGGGGGGGDAFYHLTQGGGGGGGSSYVEPSAIKSRMWTGWKAKGDGLVVFSWN
jgi:hypothetical protein